MTLSLIVPIYKRAKELEKFFRNLEHQDDQVFELVLIVDTLTEDPFAIIDNHFLQGKLNKENTKVIFNTKRFGRAKALDQGIRAATGDYALIMNPSDDFDRKLISELKNIINDKQADIIEFRAAVKSPIKFEGKILKSFPKKVDITENKDVFAYTYKFDFNKIFRTEILKKASEFQFAVVVNSRYSLEHTYKTLFFASTYANVDQELVVSIAAVSDNFNPFKELRQWRSLNTFINKSLNDKYLQEWRFSFARHILFFTSKVVKATKNKVLINKFVNEVKSELQQLKTSENVYIVHAQMEEDKWIPALIEKL